MKWTFILLASVLMSSMAFGSVSTEKQIDTLQNSTGGASISVPSVGTTLATDTNTLTLTNKSLSGSSNTFTNIPASAVSSGQLSVANGGTGASTLTLNSVLVGNGTSAVSLVGGSQYQSLIAGSGGVPAFGAVSLNQSAAVSGQLGVANGGTGASTLTSGYVLIGNGTSAVSLVAPGSSGNVLTSNGSAFVSSAPAYTPALNGGSGSPESVTASGGITLSGITGSNEVWVVGSPGAVTVTATPSVTACTADGQHLQIHGTDNTKTVKIQDQAGLSGSGLILNGDVTLAANQSITLHCDITQGLWIEDNRSN